MKTSNHAKLNCSTDCKHFEYIFMSILNEYAAPKSRKIAKFSFQQVTLVDVRKTIKDRKIQKSSGGNIPDDILNQCDLCFQALTSCINQSIVSGKFPDSLKLENTSPLYKAIDPLDKEITDLSVSFLSGQIYERLIFHQLSRYANKVLSKLLCGFR